MSRRKLFWLPSGSDLRRNKTSGYSISDLTSPLVCSELREVHGWREHSSAAAVDSDFDDVAPLSGNRLRRVPKKERRTMVIAFVNKYRETNAGKFPTISAACKQVGGSYYVTRKIIQELEYNSKFTPVNEMLENSSVQSRTKENNKPFSDLLEDSGGQEPSNTSSAASLVSNVDGLPKDSTDTNGALRNHISNDGKPKIDGTYEELQADKMRMDDAITHDLTSRSKFAGMRVSSSQKVENAKLDRDSKELASDHLKRADSDRYSQEKDVVQTSTFNEDDSEFRAGPNPSSKMRSDTPWGVDKNEETEKESNISAAKSTIDNESVDLYSITSDKSVQKTDNDEPKNSVWENLKSIADNIIGIWNRLK